MIYFVVCNDETYADHFEDDIYAVKLEDVSQLHGQKNTTVKFFNNDFPLGDDTWEIKLETLATVGYIYLVYAEWYNGEFMQDNFYPVSGRTKEELS